MRHRSTPLLTATIALSWTAAASGAMLGSDPWSFGILSFGDLQTGQFGTPTAVDGRIGALGNAVVQNVTVNASGGVAGPAIVAGGNVRAGGTVTGGVELGGNMWLQFATVNGDIVAGGNLTPLSWGTVNGSVTLGGVDQSFLPVNITGPVMENQSIVPTVDLTAATSFLTTFSNDATAAGGTPVAPDPSGALSLSVTGGPRVYSMTAAELAATTSVVVAGTVDSTLIINVTGTAPTLGNIVWSLGGGIPSSSVILNFPDALTLDITGGLHQARVLAPLAAVTFGAGSVSGSLVAASVTGTGGSVLPAASGITPMVPNSGPITLSSIALVLIGTSRGRPRPRRD